jgi:hypothetical protein
VSRKRIIVLHLAGQYPLAGVGWQAVHHLVGLARLGHDVYYVEDSGAPPYDPATQSIVVDPSRNVAFLRSMMERCGLGDRWAYVDVGAGAHYGMSAGRLRALYAEADALLNVCGATELGEEHLTCPVRIYVETDPVYEQIKLVMGDPHTERHLADHTHHFTYGEAMGTPESPIPLEKIAWRTTRPPVVLDLWDDPTHPPGDTLTTVATWRNVGKDIEFRGVRYTWSKHLNFLRFIEAPQRTSQPFELAVDPEDPDVAPLLRRHGWRVTDPYRVSRDLDAYREYILSSRGEFTVAKDLYARTHCGWFSDRSVSYLAARRPVVTQDTGFTARIPVGRGLFAFDTMDELLGAIEAVNADYPLHANAAHEIAAEYFGAERLLARLLDDAGV